MRKLIYLVIACLAIISCNEKPKNYVTFTGKITNKNSDSLEINNYEAKTRKVIKVDETGTFSDTLKVKTGIHYIFDGTEYTSLFLKNGSEINLTLDTKKFDETIIYTGKGADESNFLAKSTLIKEKFDIEELYKLPRKDFEVKLKSYEESFEKRLKENVLDS